MYHLHLKTKNASRCSSAAVVAYRTAEKLKDPRDGKIKYPHRAKDEVLTYFFVNWNTPGQSPGNREVCQELIDEIGRTETRRNSRLWREIVVALPSEGTSASREKLVVDFSCYLAEKYNVALLPAIHTPPDPTTGNYHGHILLTTRTVIRDNAKVTLGDKNRLLDTTDMLVEARRAWEELLNLYYLNLNIEKRVTCESNAKRKKESIPTIHEGPYHRRFKGPRWQRNQEISKFNEKIFELRKEMEESNREIATLQKEICDEINRSKLNKRQREQAIRLKHSVVASIREGGTAVQFSENLKSKIGRRAEAKNAFYRLKKSLPAAGGDAEVQRARNGIELMASLFANPNEETLEKLKRWAQGETQVVPITPSHLCDLALVDKFRDWEEYVAEQVWLTPAKPRSASPGVRGQDGPPL
jgi:hypothetical protein